MKYIIRSQKKENTDAIKEYIEAKLSKLDKYFKDADDIEANVLTKVNGRYQTIEVTIPTKHFTLRNEESNEDLYAAIDSIVDKLERQIRKNKEKINTKINKTYIQDFSQDLEDEFEQDEKVVRRKTVDLKPIDEEEAIIQMNMLGHSFFVYKNVEDGNICVIYKRKDGNYGLIETE